MLSCAAMAAGPASSYIGVDKDTGKRVAVSAVSTMGAGLSGDSYIGIDKQTGKQVSVVVIGGAAPSASSAAPSPSKPKSGSQPPAPKLPEEACEV